MVYTSDTLRCFLQEVSDSNLTPSAKVTARQLAADAIALSAKVQALQGELAKLQQQRVNETVNQPSSKKPEWDKGNATNPDRPRPKCKLGGRRPGSGNRRKTHPEPDRSVHNPLEQCPKCQADLSDVPPAEDFNQRIIEDIEPPAEKTVVTVETSERKWCPSCQQIVSAKSELGVAKIRHWTSRHRPRRLSLGGGGTVASQHPKVSVDLHAAGHLDLRNFQPPDPGC